jgi:Raf kinase inhibitor-like YbhB/YbcL family protein
VIRVRELVLASPAFGNHQSIPKKYTCDGDDVNPMLSIEGIPKDTKSLVLVIDDPDAPMGTWDHWVVWNILPRDKIEENSVPGVEGMNSFRKHSYGGPCPPSGTHRYFFRVYALDTLLDLPPNSGKKDVEKAMKDHMIAKGELIGLYSRR